ncbi:MAG: xanthine dehydrogenase family protein subunit M [Pseudomonadota bacterium]
MIPAPFAYHQPASVSAALAILQEHGDEARVIAGGHSLIPLMKQRMTDISHLIDLKAIDALGDISVAGDRVTIGAMVTQHEIIESAALRSAAPLLREAALQIADPQVRYCGTIGGNVANGDPGNDMPAIMQCLDATFTLEGAGGVRTLNARDFYIAAYTTERDDGEILTSISFAAQKGGTAYEKQKRKIGDYATAAAAVTIERQGGVASSASVAMTNLADIPIYSAGAGAALVGTPVDAAAIKASIAAMQDDIEPTSDNRGPAEFKRHAAGVILSRAISRAWSNA